MPNWSQHSFENGVTDDPIDAGDGYCHRAENLLLDSNRKLVQRPWLKPFIDQETGTGATNIFNFGQVKTDQHGRILTVEGSLDTGINSNIIAYKVGTSPGGPYTVSSVANSPGGGFVSYFPEVARFSPTFKELPNGVTVLSNRNMMAPKKVYPTSSLVAGTVAYSAGLPKPNFYLTTSDSRFIAKNLIRLGNVFSGLPGYNCAFPNMVLYETFDLHTNTASNYTLKFKIGSTGNIITLTSPSPQIFTVAMANLQAQIIAGSYDSIIEARYGVLGTPGTPTAVGYLAISMSTIDLAGGAASFSAIGFGTILSYHQFNSVETTDTLSVSYVIRKIEMVHSSTYKVRIDEVDTIYTDVSAPFTVFARFYYSGTNFYIFGPGNNYTSYEYSYPSTMLLQAYISDDNLSVTYLRGSYASTLTSQMTLTPDTYTNTVALGLPILYTNGGILPNDAPPRSRYFHYVNESATAYYGWYFGINTFYTQLTDIEYSKTKILQSKSGDFDSVPADNIIDVGDNITGISSYRGIPIVFGEKSVNRIDGIYDDSGGGLATAVNFSNDTGCLSHDSIVEIESGLLFAGIDGIYWTNGYQARNLTPHLRKTYADLVKDGTSYFDKQIYATYDKDKKHVWFTFPNAGQSLAYVIDLTYGLGQQAVLMGPQCAEVERDGVLILSTHMGPIKYFENGVVVCPRVSIGISPRTLFKFTDRNQNSSNTWKLGDYYWNLSTFVGNSATNADVDGVTKRLQGWPVQCRLKTVSSSMGDPAKNKWVTNLRTIHPLKYKSFDKSNALFSGETADLTYLYEDTISVEVTSNNNNGMKLDKLKSRYSANVKSADNSYYSTDQYAMANDSTVGFKQGGMAAFDMRFPAKSLRAKYKQLEIATGKITILKSDTLSTATWYDIGPRKALWVSGTIFGAVDSLVGQIVSIKWSIGATVIEKYQNEFVISGNSPDTLVLAGDFTINPGNYFLPTNETSNIEWVVRGVPRDQVWTLSGFDVTYNPFAGAEKEYSNSQGNSDE